MALFEVVEHFFHLLYLLFLDLLTHHHLEVAFVQDLI